MSATRSKTYISTTLEPTYIFTKKYFFTYITEINLAHVLMLKQQDILPAEEADTILEATLEQLKQGFTKDYHPSFEDLFFMLEADLKEKIGPELVGNMHIAFSRNDMDTTMFRMFWRKKIAQWVNHLTALRTVILELVQEHSHTIMPAHTHNQQAQPTTLAHYLMAVDRNLQRDMERGLQLYHRINVSPMGAAALATTGFPIDRQAMCDRLGFEKPMSNSYDAISASDFMMEIQSTLMISLTTISRFVYDLIFMTTNEVNTLRLHDKHVQSSSIMPQKRNPSALEHTRATISKAIGELTGSTMLAHNVPLGDIVDIGDDIQPLLLSGYDHTTDVLTLLTEILANCTFNKAKMYEKAQSGFSTVTELSDTLVREHGISFRTAHKIVSLFVKELTSKGEDLLSGSAEQLNTIAKEQVNVLLAMSEEEFQRAINVQDFVRIRKIVGGPSPSEVERQHHEAMQELSEHKQWVSNTFHKLNTYSQELAHEVELCVKDKISRGKK